MRPRTAGLVLLLLLGCAAPGGGFDSDRTGRALLASSVPESRIAYYNAAIARNSSDAEALRGLGREYARQAAWQSSAGAYREALIVNAGDVDALLGFGRAQIALGDAPGAYRSAAAALERRETLPALVLAGVALDMAGNRPEARAHYERALAKDRRDLDVRNNIALTMALSGDPGAHAAMTTVAFAPDADGRHRRNLVLVSAILGLDAQAAADASRLGLGAAERDAIVAIGRRARSNGAQAMGLASFP